MADAERIARVRITGRVQGVGFRVWVEGEAIARGLDGWVRNKRDGSVEALFSGNAADVADMLTACREGPPMAIVNNLDITETAEPAGRGFRVLPTD
jgi:acylphosphatase